VTKTAKQSTGNSRLPGVMEGRKVMDNRKPQFKQKQSKQYKIDLMLTFLVRKTSNI
jgi:hypothetical protein